MKINADVVQLARLVLKRYQNAIETTTAPYGLTPLKGLLVTFLCNNPDKDSPAEAVHYLRLSKGNVSSAVISLEKKRLLERHSDPHDHRKSHLCLTPKAEPLCQAIQTTREDYFNRLVSGLSKDDIHLLEKDFDIILRNINHDEQK
jgi:DNA-binding MarR family transcriptional regulator